jgi:lysozyme
MRCSETGINFIKSFEKCRLTAYLPTPNDKWTVGWGMTLFNGTPVTEGLVVTQAEADKAFAACIKAYEQSVSIMVTMTIKQNQFDALVSLAYNIGLAALKRSTLLKKLNGGDLQTAAAEFLKWDKQAGEVLPGLTKRRKAEQKMFNS